MQIRGHRQMPVLTFQTMAKLVIAKVLHLAEKMHLLDCKVEEKCEAVLGVKLNKKPHLIPYSTVPISIPLLSHFGNYFLLLEPRESHVRNMLLNLESSKALLSTVKVMMINARVVVSPSNDQYSFFLPLLLRVEKK